MTGTETIRLPHRFPIALGLVCAAFFGFCAVMAWRSGQGEVTPVFLAFVLMGLYLALSSGVTELDPVRVRHRSALGSYAIAWHEVVQIEVDPQHQALLFRGRDKQVVTLGGAYWPRARRDAAYALMEAKARELDIPIVESARTIVSWSRGTRE